MVCENPVIRGFYPDPSVCEANGTFYLVTSTFEYFPGIPVFESKDLVHWKQIGHCLTRQSQLDVRGVEASGGIFAPTIRFHNGRFYVVVTNVSGNYGNFYVYTDDIYSGEWSEPVKVQRSGIDPSLLFDGDKAYFISNGTDDFGKEGVSLCEIDIATGAMRSKARCISTGCGGRYLEAPHVYHINDWYYLMVAEGGTEYGHMECLLRSRDIWGPYEMCPHNPILTNRNLGGYAVQGAGHADLIEGPNGQWFMVHLAFRQISRWMPFHNLGRETFLMPVFWTDDGWLTVGADGTCRSHWSLETDANGIARCTILPEPQYAPYTWALKKSRACYLRLPDFSNYQIEGEEPRAIAIKGSADHLGSLGQVSFIGMRQEEHTGALCVSLDTSTLLPGQEAGITAYLTETDYYAVYAQKNASGTVVLSARLVIGGNVVSQKSVESTGPVVSLKIESDPHSYILSAQPSGGTFTELARGHTKFLSSEVACGFTGTILALYVNAAPDGASDWVTFRW